MPTTARASPTIAQGMLAFRWASGLVHTPQVIPIVHRPLAR